MSNLPQKISRLHFIGIGGIGMSGIAEILHHQGLHISGSDVAENANVQRLQAKGIKVHVGHEASNIEGSQAVVVSTAVNPDNVEVLAAQEQFLPVVHRSEMLAEIMRPKKTIAVAGTHGKTTTTSLVAAILDGAALHPTVINGGIINTYGSNARPGNGDWVVAEADESDGSFTCLPTTFGVVTNIDPEHMEHYGSFDNLKQAFAQFIGAIPFYGLGVMCVDHPVVRELIKGLHSKRLVTYGFAEDAEVRAVNIRSNTSGMTFDVVLKPSAITRSPLWSEARQELSEIKDIFLPMYGDHNVANALAAIAIGFELGVTAEQIKQSLAGFLGVRRRFTKVGEVGGVAIIDDYAHHPVEIRTVLQAAKKATEGRVIAVVQPHRYTRLQSLFEDFCGCFEDCDHLFIAPVYPAGEQPIEGFSEKQLAECISGSGCSNVKVINGEDDLPDSVCMIAKPGDMVICMGAGNITQWAANLPARLEKLSS